MIPGPGDHEIAMKRSAFHLGDDPVALDLGRLPWRPEMQFEIRKRHGAFDRIDGRRGAGAAKPQRLFPARCVRQGVVIVVSARVAAAAGDRHRRDRWPPGEQMHRSGAGFQRHAGRIERRCGGTDHRHHLAAQRAEIDGILGMRVTRSWQRLGQDARDVGAAIAGEASGQHDLSRRFDLGLAIGGEMQPEVSVGRLDPAQPGPVADWYFKEMTIPAQVLGPVGALDAVDRGIGGGGVPRLVPSLKAERWNPEFRPRQCLRRAQQVHPRGIQPNARSRLVCGGVDDRDMADARPAQREGDAAAGLPATDDGDVVVDPRMVRHPVRRIGTDLPQRIAGDGIGVGWLAHRGYLVGAPRSSVMACEEANTQCHNAVPNMIAVKAASSPTRNGLLCQRDTRKSPE